MFQIADLRLKQDILPLFDFTLNDISKELLWQLMIVVPTTKDEVLERQDIIKGFIENLPILDQYAYAKMGFYEIYSFLTKPDLPSERLSTFQKIFSPKHQKLLRQPNYVQFILFFDKLLGYYFSKISIADFPESYKEEITFLLDVLNAFRPNHYAELLKEDKFKHKHVVELNEILLQTQKDGSIEKFFKLFFRFESFLSIAKATQKHGFCFPVFSKIIFSIAACYHPMLSHPIKNDFTTFKNIVLLTGANMSGKSTLLKSFGLLAYLSRIGFSVPAESASLPFYESIFVMISHNDDLQSGYSHFMSEIMNLKSVLLRAKNGGTCLAIFDELLKLAQQHFPE